MSNFYFKRAWEYGQLEDVDILCDDRTYPYDEEQKGRVDYDRKRRSGFSQISR